jgi:iron complex transport system substrate-binding protein
MTIRTIAALVLAFVVSVSPSQPRAQTDANSVPTRVISLVPAVTEMVFAIGAGDQVVGVSSFDHYPPAVETRTRVGALIDPDFERILTLKPDLVIVYGSQKDLVTRLNGVHIPVFPYVHAGLADIPVTMRALGTRLGHAAEAERVTSTLERDIAGIRAQYANSPHPRTALIMSRESHTLRGLFASGGYGFLHDMLLAAGARDAFDDIKREGIQVSAEMMLSRAPDVILEVHPTGEVTPGQIEALRAPWATLASVPAVRDHRIFEIADDVALVPGPRVAEGIRLIAKAIHQP